MNRASSLIGRVVGIALRIAVALAGLVVVAVLMVCAATLALSLHARARLRGRPSALQFAWRGSTGAAARGWRTAAAPKGAAPDDVVDAEVREIAPARREVRRLGEG